MEELQAVADDPVRRIDVCQRLSDLSGEFVSVAKRYGKLIIAERFLPENLKVRFSSVFSFGLEHTHSTRRAILIMFNCLS